MPGKRLRLVRSSTSFDDMSVLNEPLPPPELRMKMKPPRYPAKILIEGDNVPQLAILTLPSPYMKKENDRGHIGNFLDRCNCFRCVHFVALSAVTDKLMWTNCYGLGQEDELETVTESSTKKEKP
ncbi:hypothetical protein DVH24_041951 [Malus domestica]|uniref:Uncharacterized protein n=1 Tax=Malus domestica TaxID=3750 RepID=A0A498IUY4_MALDO|nr:hypothetical protein DVH24_041951 [Malus domestica]